MNETTVVPGKESLVKRLWKIEYSVPKSRDGRTWQSNQSLRVSAETMEQALSAAKARYPNATLWQINHRGVLDISI